jgi:hypothetical protein
MSHSVADAIRNTGNRAQNRLTPKPGISSSVKTFEVVRPFGIEDSQLVTHFERE